MKRFSIMIFLPVLLSFTACKNVKESTLFIPLISNTSSTDTSASTGQTTINLGSSVTATDPETIPPVLSGNIQFDQVTLSASTNYTLGTAVSANSAFVVCTFQTSSSSVENTPSCQLSSDGTQVQVSKNGGSSVNVNYSVLNFSSGMTVQRGSSTFTAGTAQATLTTAVNTARSFLVLSTRTSETTSASDARRLVRGVITNSTTLDFTCYQCTNTSTVEWQVVQWNASSVITNSLTIADGNSSGTATLPSSVDLTKSFLISNYTYTTGANVGFEDNYMLHGRFSSSSELTFQRGSSAGSLNIQYYVVSVSSGISVKSNSYSLTDTQLTLCDTIPSSGVTNYLKTMLIASNRIGNEGPSVSNFDSGSIRYAFGVAGCGSLGNTHISMTRHTLGEGSPNHTISGSYFLIEFN
ncbi:MAG: hypothetical protein SH817_05750 [Leptospira sp.]|nr:hypothetical protein [Leptospira sp.]